MIDEVYVFEKMILQFKQGVSKLQPANWIRIDSGEAIPIQRYFFFW